jgi:hypothetical protein
MNTKDSEALTYKTAENAFEERNYRAYFIGVLFSRLVILE